MHCVRRAYCDSFTADSIGQPATRSSGCLDNKRSRPIEPSSKYRRYIQTQQQPYSYRISSRMESEFARLKQLLREADKRVEQERNRADSPRAGAKTSRPA